MKIAAKILFLLLLLSVASVAKRRDPLTEAEADQLRQVAMEPYNRIKLMIKFTEARLTSIDQVRLDPKQAADRGKQIHDLLEDFASLMDEINDNLDQYEARNLDKDTVKQYHKGLKELIEADARFDTKLQALKTASETDPVTKKEAPDFRFVLQDAMDSLKSNADMAREYIETTHDQKGQEKK
jgi:thioester reductase-like protein